MANRPDTIDRYYTRGEFNIDLFRSVIANHFNTPPREITTSFTLKIPSNVDPNDLRPTLERMGIEVGLHNFLEHYNAIHCKTDLGMEDMVFGENFEVIPRPSCPGFDNTSFNLVFTSGAPNITDPYLWRQTRIR